MIQIQIFVVFYVVRRNVNLYIFNFEIFELDEVFEDFLKSCFACGIDFFP